MGQALRVDKPAFLTQDELVLQDWWLERCLGSRSVMTRQRAVERLAGRADPAAMRLLRLAAQDPDAAVRRAAMSALGQAGSDEAVQLLAAGLRDGDEQVQETAVLALRRVGGPNAVHALSRALGQGSSRVQFRVAQALEALGWRPAGPEEETAWSVARGEYERAAELGGVALPLLARRLREGEYAERLSVVRSLIRCEDAGAGSLLMEALRDPDAAVRTAAAEGLGLRMHAPAVPALIRLLKDPMPQVRAAAAAALGQLRDGAAVEPLIRALEDAQWEVRAAALEALGRLGDRRAFPSVAARLEDSEQEVREQAAETLGVVGDESVVEKLVLTLMDPHSGVRQAAARALHRIDPGWQRSPRVQNLLPTLQSALHHRDPGVQLAAAGLIRQITGLSPGELERQGGALSPVHRREAAARALELLAGDFDAAVRLAAVRALGRLGLRRSIPALQARLNDPHPSVAAGAHEALQRCHAG